MLLTTNTMYQAGLWLLTLTCLEEHDEQDENANLRFPKVCTEKSGKLTDQDIIEWLDSVMTPEAKLELVATIAHMVGQCSHAWKYDVGLVFYHMGLSDNREEQVKALYYLLMGCFGHGVSLEDFSYERGDLLDMVEKKLGSTIPVRFEAAPCRFDQHEQLYNLADTFMDNREKSVQ